MTAAPPTSIGPGRFVLVVGPSGGGKDTLIALAKTACRADRKIVFPRRIVTRTTSAAEDHDSLDDAAFDRAATDGGFAFWWQAHGLKYAIPSSAADDVRAGRTVICNVSRAIVAEVRARYSQVDVVLVTAPAEILAARLAGRSRASDGPLEQRIKRNDAFAGFRADYTIDNAGAPGTAARQLLDVLTRA
jgi:ribose 1,5-bisphosphokinase